MTPEQVRETVHRVTAKLFAVDPSTLGANTDLREDLGADSMALVEFVISLEEAFNLQMDNVVEMKVRTLGDVVRVIAEGVGAKTQTQSSGEQA